MIPLYFYLFVVVPGLPPYLCPDSREVHGVDSKIVVGGVVVVADLLQRYVLDDTNRSSSSSWSTTTTISPMLAAAAAATTRTTIHTSVPSIQQNQNNDQG